MVVIIVLIKILRQEIIGIAILQMKKLELQEVGTSKANDK